MSFKRRTKLYPFAIFRCLMLLAFILPLIIMLYSLFLKPYVYVSPSFSNEIPEYINCDLLFSGDIDEMEKADEYHKHNGEISLNTDWDIYNKTKNNCKQFINDRKYVMNYINKEEKEFPIAFSMLVYKSIGQVERLLRAIYRPQNIYCIHVDIKAEQQVYDSVSQLAACFKNVFILEKRIDVDWGFYSVLEPELGCMEELVLRNKNWKYFINLSGMEFPLVTNGDLVKILKIYNGSNEMEGKSRKFQHMGDVVRTKFVHISRNEAKLGNQLVGRSTMLKSPPPHNISIVKGGIQSTLSRAFVDYILTDKVALEFREWIKDTGHPDETFFATLNYNKHLQVPGGFKGDLDEGIHMMISRLSIWQWEKDRHICGGRLRHAVCVYGVRDLAFLTANDRVELFANKFIVGEGEENIALACMEKRHFERIHQEYNLQSRIFNTSFYSKQEFTYNHY